MCQSPIMLPSGIEAACRKCRLCTDNVTKDWVGRCLAESKTAVATHSVTLTYAPKDGVDRHERTAVLTYSDIQLYLKTLRNKGYPVRYLIAGEYGTKKGRAHWHGIFFWQEKVPPHKLYKMFNDDLWPHGHQVWKRPAPQHVKYCCKYIRKDQKDTGAQGKFVVSTKPHLGAYYFADLADRMAADGKVPMNPHYKFPEAKLKNGKPMVFCLRRTASDKYRYAAAAAWEKRNPDRHMPPSEYMQKLLDPETCGEENEARAKFECMIAKVKAQAEIEEAQERINYRRRHNEYHFGKNMSGLYNVDWEPDADE